MLTLTSRFSLLAAVLASGLLAQDLPKGQIVDDVQCQADPTQTYSVYLPSTYSPERKWSLILAFDPRGRGHVPVAQFQAAAEKYGYVVIGSNNSRNGPVRVSVAASKALIQEAQTRYSIDPKRFYAAGQSGGARFALDLALSSKLFAGVVASSAGFAHPAGDDVSVPFVIFGTAGTEDFNYVEMRKLNRQLTSPHRIVVFKGDHTWLPSDLAVDALTWLEIQAMKSGLRPRDEASIDASLKARKEHLIGVADKGELYLETASLAADFKGLRNVDSWESAKATMESEKDVMGALQASLIAEMNEGQMNAEISNYADQLRNPAEHDECMAALRERLTKLGAEAKAPEDSPKRRMARRLIRGVIADGRPDPDFRKLLEEVRP